ncbi:MAG: cytochrome C biogenesis protein CcdA [Nitrospirales bacterium]|nr:MAG: cytochrome C biogenesis protein CcdA [Nitrospirales bacterium]
MIESTAQIPQVTLLSAFGAGLLSFLSPCVLPLVPSYISYVTGLSVEQLQKPTECEQFRKSIILNSLLFIAGFSSIFIVLGASASLFGQWLFEYQEYLRKVGGVLIILMGLYVLGLFNVGWLATEKRLHFHTRPLGYGGSFLIGVAFAAGWTPCIGPILGTILLYASTSETYLDGLTLLAFYSLGLGVPLFAAAVSLERFLSHFKKIQRYIKGVSIVSGVLLIAVGILLYSNAFVRLTSILERSGVWWYIGQ